MTKSLTMSCNVRQLLSNRQYAIAIQLTAFYKLLYKLYNSNCVVSSYEIFIYADIVILE